MNDERCVKENPNPKKAEELAKAILNESISDQNEIFERLRLNLIEERKAYIAKLQNDSADLSEQISYAGSSLEKIFMGQVK